MAGEYIIRSTERLGYLTAEGGYTSDSAEARRFPTEESARKEILRRAPVTLMREEVMAA